tara:strand:- start:1437 stop:1877 length:441 start_codon:yes stop_codon:yes gene_type:complete
MPPRKEDSNQVPPIGRFGGVKLIERRIGRSETLAHNKEAVAAELIAMGTARITDIVDLATGRVKDISLIPDYALAAIKKVTVSELGTTVELFDKVSVLRVLAKASGMLDVEKNENKPSIVGINMKGPEIAAPYEEVIDGESPCKED